jgi:hypothetical protein
MAHAVPSTSPGADSSFFYRALQPGDLKSFYGIEEVLRDLRGWVFFVGGQMIGIAAVMRDPELTGTLMEDDARLFGFLDVKGQQPLEAGMVGLKQMRKHLRENTEDVFVQCDVVNFPFAPRLLTMLGFKPTEEFRVDRRNGKYLRVWQWQHLGQSSVSSAA